jgi:hypothetical protein
LRKENKWTKLLLAYPGTGARTLQKASPNSTLLDNFGFRSPPLNYWCWVISIDILRSRIADFTLRQEKHQFIGWGINWREIINLFPPESIGIHSIDPVEYEANVKAYRLTSDYVWDLKLIGDDHPVQYYVDGYSQWIAQAMMYFADYIEGYHR